MATQIDAIDAVRELANQSDTHDFLIESNLDTERAHVDGSDGLGVTDPGMLVVCCPP